MIVKNFFYEIELSHLKKYLHTESFGILPCPFFCLRLSTSSSSILLTYAIQHSRLHLLSTNFSLHFSTLPVLVSLSDPSFSSVHWTFLYLSQFNCLDVVPIYSIHSKSDLQLQLRKYCIIYNCQTLCRFIEYWLLKTRKMLQLSR